MGECLRRGRKRWNMGGLEGDGWGDIGSVVLGYVGCGGVIGIVVLMCGR